MSSPGLMPPPATCARHPDLSAHGGISALTPDTFVLMLGRFRRNAYKIAPSPCHDHPMVVRQTMDIQRFRELCARSSTDRSARDQLWTELHNSLYRKLCRQAEKQMFTPLRHGPPDHFAQDAIQRAVETCVRVHSTVLGYVGTILANLIRDAARQEERRYDSSVVVDDGLTDAEEDRRVVGDEPEGRTEPLRQLLEKEENTVEVCLQKRIAAYRETLRGRAESSRMALYKLELLEGHHYAGMEIRELTECLARRLKAKGDTKGVSYGNMRNANVELLKELRAFYRECCAAQGDA